jgi:hypothetical protein
VNEDGELTGRNLEPWRALLAVARWLDDRGVPDLWKRMSGLSVAYQQEKPELESSDLTALVIRALCHCAIKSMSAIDIGSPPQPFVFKTEDITAAAKLVIAEEELDLDPEKVTSRRIGRTLGRMRFRQEPRPGGKGSRLWTMSRSDILRWASLYSVPVPEELQKDADPQPDTPDSYGTNGGNGTNGTAGQSDPRPNDQDEAEAARMAEEERRGMREEAEATGWEDDL